MPGQEGLDGSARGRLLFGSVTQIHDMTALELAASVADGQLSPVEIADHYLDRIDRLNEQTGAFYTVTAELAKEQAATAEKLAAESRRAGDQASSLPPLNGVPIPIKDLNMVAGVRMTLGSTIFADNVATEDDYVVAELRKAGIVITGKTATPEFGLPCYTETKIGPPARTPWDLTRSAGGSPGAGAPDRRGPPPPPPPRRRERAGRRRATPAGAHVACDLRPGPPEAVPMCELLWYSMATLAPVQPDQEDQLLPLTRYLRDKGRKVSATELIFAQAYLQGMMRPAMTVMNRYDAILSPTLASPPVPVGYFDEVEPAENFQRQKRFTPYTAIYNISGQPAVNLPLYWNADGLPIGVMLAGRLGDEATLISLSAQVEAATPWRDRHPPIWEFVGIR